MSRPEPRPALQRSEDGTVHPAAPRVAAEQHLHPVPHAPAAQSPSGAPNGGGVRASKEPPASASFTGKPTSLTVEVPKDLRKAVRRTAERQGRSVDAVVVDALADHLTK